MGHTRVNIVDFRHKANVQRVFQIHCKIKDISYMQLNCIIIRSMQLLYGSILKISSDMKSVHMLPGLLCQDVCQG